MPRGPDHFSPGPVGGELRLAVHAFLGNVKARRPGRGRGPGGAAGRSGLWPCCLLALGGRTVPRTGTSAWLRRSEVALGGASDRFGRPARLADSGSQAGGAESAPAARGRRRSGLCGRRLPGLRSSRRSAELQASAPRAAGAEARGRGGARGGKAVRAGAAGGSGWGLQERRAPPRPSFPSSGPEEPGHGPNLAGPAP